MTLKEFFRIFDQLADAPNAIAKTREMVLRLAMAGRLSERIALQESGHIILQQMRTRFGHLAQKRGDVGNPINAGDLLEIPKSWARCTIAEVCKLQTGATPSRQEKRYFGGNIPWLVSGDINKGQISNCEGRITQDGLENSNCKIIPANSVLIALNGQGKTRATVAMLRISAALNQSLVAMTPYSPELLIPEFIFWNLRGRYHPIRDITGQDQRRGLNMKIVGQQTLPVPPVAEQKCIVSKVDELMALCDRLEAQQQERKTLAEQLLNAVVAEMTRQK